VGNTSNCGLQMRSNIRTQVLSMQGTTRNRGLQMEMIMGRRRKSDVSPKGESSGTSIPSRPHSLEAKLDDLVELAARTFMVLGPLLVLVGFLYLMGGHLTAGTITAMIGVFMVYYAYK